MRADVQSPPAPRGVGVHWSHTLWPGHGNSLIRATLFSGFLLTIFWALHAPPASEEQLNILSEGWTDQNLFCWCLDWAESVEDQCVDHPDSTEVYERSADLFLHRIMGRVCGWIPCEVKSGKLFLSDFDAKSQKYQTISSWHVFHLHLWKQFF